MVLNDAGVDDCGNEAAGALRNPPVDGVGRGGAVGGVDGLDLGPVVGGGSVEEVLLGREAVVGEEAVGHLHGVGLD